MTETPASAGAAADPEELGQLFVRYFAAGDLDNLVNLYTEDGLFVPEPGAFARGHEQVRGALGAMHAAGARIALDPRRMHVVGDTALISHVGTVSGVAPDGSDMVTTSTEVARRGTDGTWRYILDDPFFSV